MGVSTYLEDHITDPFFAKVRACEKAIYFARDLGSNR